jgi:hypothetical protein
MGQSLSMGVMRNDVKELSRFPVGNGAPQMGGARRAVRS